MTSTNCRNIGNAFSDISHSFYDDSLVCQDYFGKPVEQERLVPRAPLGIVVVLCKGYASDATDYQQDLWSEGTEVYVQVYTHVSSNTGLTHACHLEDYQEVLSIQMDFPEVPNPS